MRTLDLKNRNILITGVAGFIGANVAKKYLKLKKIYLLLELII